MTMLMTLLTTVSDNIISRTLVSSRAARESLLPITTGKIVPLKLTLARKPAANRSASQAKNKRTSHDGISNGLNSHSDITSEFIPRIEPTAKDTANERPVDPIAARIAEKELQSSKRMTRGTTGKPEPKHKVIAALHEKAPQHRNLSKETSALSVDYNIRAQTSNLEIQPPKEEKNKLSSAKRKADGTSTRLSKRSRPAPTNAIEKTAITKSDAPTPKTPARLPERKPAIVGWSNTGPRNQGTVKKHSSQRPLQYAQAAMTDPEFSLDVVTEHDSPSLSDVARKHSPNDATKAVEPAPSVLPPVKNVPSKAFVDRHSSQTHVTEAGSPILLSQHNPQVKTREEAGSDKVDVNHAYKNANSDVAGGAQRLPTSKTSEPLAGVISDQPRNLAASNPASGLQSLYDGWITPPIRRGRQFQNPSSISRPIVNLYSLARNQGRVFKQPQPAETRSHNLPSPNQARTNAASRLEKGGIFDPARLLRNSRIASAPSVDAQLSLTTSQEQALASPMPKPQGVEHPPIMNNTSYASGVEANPPDDRSSLCADPTQIRSHRRFSSNRFGHPFRHSQKPHPSSPLAPSAIDTGKGAHFEVNGGIFDAQTNQTLIPSRSSDPFEGTPSDLKNIFILRLENSTFGSKHAKHALNEYYENNTIKQKVPSQSAQPDDPEKGSVNSPMSTGNRKRKADRIDESTSQSSTVSSTGEGSSNARGSEDRPRTRPAFNYEPHQEVLYNVLKGIVNVSHTKIGSSDIADFDCQRLAQHQAKKESILHKIVNDYLASGRRAIGELKEEIMQELGREGSDVQKFRDQLASDYAQCLHEVIGMRKARFFADGLERSAGEDDGSGQGRSRC